MNHLTDAEFIDLLDGHLAEERVAHVGRCDRCRGSANMLRASLARVEATETPDPSPLFWDHFAARVADGIRDEPTPSAADPMTWSNWLRHPVSGWAAAASVALLLMVAAAWRATLHAPSAPPPSQFAFSDPGTVLPSAREAAPDDLDADGAWAVVRAAAEGLAWEDVEDAGLSARPGSAERVALELSAAERAALAHLLEAELKRDGA